MIVFGLLVAFATLAGMASADGLATSEPSFSMAPSFELASPKPSLEHTNEPSFSVIPTAVPTKMVENSRPVGSCLQRQICEYFDTTPSGEKVKHGDYVSDEWASLGFFITASSKDGGYTPGGRARIMDTAHPGSDVDLGSPNQGCPGGGPGMGAGGIPGAKGENCLYQGNAVIIQEEKNRDVDDNAYGGSIKFSFNHSVTVLAMGAMDLDYGESGKLEYEYFDGKESFSQPLYGLGDNSVQDIEIEQDNVSSMTYTIDHSGAIRFICYCDSEEGGTSIPPPAPPPPPVPAVPTEEICVYFQHDAYGREISHGDYVGDNWIAWGLNITVSPGEGGYAPGGNGRIMDTSRPGSESDLGSPNHDCPQGGPGVGDGGRPFMPGENCDFEGNVLIIQEEKDRDIDDNAYGGSIKFRFTYAATLKKIGLMDIEQGSSASLGIERVDGTWQTTPVYGLGDNSVQTVWFWDEYGVASVQLHLVNSGAVRFLCYSF